MRTSTACTPGAIQLRVVIPGTPAPVTGMGFGLAVRDASKGAGQGVFIAVRQTFPVNEFWPGCARLLMSKPLSVAWSTATWTGGLPTVTFRRIVFPWSPATRQIPFEFPTAAFSSITLSVLAADT